MHTANTIQQGVCQNNGNNYTAVPPLATICNLVCSQPFRMSGMAGVHSVVGTVFICGPGPALLGPNIYGPRNHHRRL